MLKVLSFNTSFTYGTSIFRSVDADAEFLKILYPKIIKNFAHSGILNCRRFDVPSFVPGPASKMELSEEVRDELSRKLSELELKIIAKQTFSSQAIYELGIHKADALKKIE